MSQLDTKQELLASKLMRLRALGVQDNAILKAIEAIPRAKFLAPELAEHAFSSRIFPIACGGYSESIDVLARLLLHLDVKPHHRVLEVGCGSGYSAAILSRLADKVMTIDRYNSHCELASEIFNALELGNIAVQQLDGSKNVAGEGTFDRIYVSASFSEMPRQYADHLGSGGVMIAPLSLGNGFARMMRLTKIGSRFEREDLFEVPDSPLIEGIAAAL